MLYKYVYTWSNDFSSASCEPFFHISKTVVWYFFFDFKIDCLLGTIAGLVSVTLSMGPKCIFVCLQMYVHAKNNHFDCSNLIYIFVY